MAGSSSNLPNSVPVWASSASGVPQSHIYPSVQQHISPSPYPQPISSPSLIGLPYHQQPAAGVRPISSYQSAYPPPAHHQPQQQQHHHPPHLSSFPSLAFLSPPAAAPAPSQPKIMQSFYRFRHQRQFSNAGHDDVVLHYKTWDESDWTARLANGMFYVTRSGQAGGHSDSIINYKAWDGSNWTARLTTQDNQPAFYHVRQYATSGHTDKALQYHTWDGSCWMTTLVPDPSLSAFLS